MFDQFASQRSRGSEGFGLFDGQETHLIRTASEDKILKWLSKYNSNLILFHHRFPTSTINVAQAAHPMTTAKYFGDKQYIMVHNGVIKNADKLFVKHQELGIEYRTLLRDLTFNDSESLLWELALTLEGKQKDMAAIGNMAFVLLELDKHKLVKMHFGRNSRPLKLYRDKETFEISSEGRGESIPWDVLYTYNYQLNRLTHKDYKFKEFEFKDWAVPTSCQTSSQTTFGHDDWYGEDDDDVTNYDSYDEWVMAQEYKKIDQASIAHIGQIIKDRKFVKNEDGIYVTEPDILDVNALTDDELENYRPALELVQAETLNYLTKAKGNFETAYWLVEKDYDNETDLDFTPESLRRAILLENVIEYIEYDPEYKNKRSVSSEWRSLCQQKLLTV